MVAHDFELVPRGPTLLLLRPTRPTPPGLFPDAVMASGARTPDAWLLPPTAHPRRRAFSLRPALLRAPPARPATPYSATLFGHRGTEAQPRTWAAHLLAHPDWLDAPMRERARAAIAQLVGARLGGTWWGAPPPTPAAGRTLVFAAADPSATARMLGAAVARSGAARTLLVAERPGPLAPLCRRLGIAILPGVLDPWPLIEDAAHIHADPDSEPGLLARLAGIPATIHGARPNFDPAALAAATLLLGARYTDPFSGAPATPEAFLDQAAEWRRQTAGHAEIGCLVGISFWKRRRLAQMLGAHRRPAFRRTARAAIATAASRGGAIAVWASRAPAGLATQPLIRIEDGFIRSAGLGADFLPPLSIVLDRAGLYYDATSPSDLESILAESRFSEPMLRRAATLRQRIIEAGITKYNLATPAQPLHLPTGRPILLVPGQVADDRSVLLGGAGLPPGLPLLEAVRRHNPHACILYKPHPDVEAGHRPGAIPDALALRHADLIVRDTPMAALLDRIDEVHTLTSLTGFEALLRGKPVTTYGHPFYAGWGLTTDRNPPPRRTRPLPLDALVAGTLILYPRYIDPVTLLPCGPETVLDRLSDPAHQARLRAASPLVQARRLQGRISACLAKMAPTTTSTPQNEAAP